MSMKDWKKELLTIPNLLSLIRLGLIPAFLGVHQKEHYAASAVILIISCLTDLADGIIARQYNMISTVGKVLDPLADKATQILLVWFLSRQYPVLLPILVLLGIKESFQLFAALLALHHGKMLPGALFAGKLCTTILFISLILLVLFPKLSSDTVMLLTAADGIFLLYSFTAYIGAYYGRCQKTQNIQ